MKLNVFIKTLGVNNTLSHLLSKGFSCNTVTAYKSCF